MRDKKAEIIEIAFNAVGLYHTLPEELRLPKEVALKEFENILRKNGWHHEDDEVEGMYVCESAKHKDCPMYFSKLCIDDEHNCYNRLATIKDIIEGRARGE